MSHTFSFASTATTTVAPYAWSCGCGCCGSYVSLCTNSVSQVVRQSINVHHHQGYHVQHSALLVNIVVMVYVNHHRVLLVLHVLLLPLIVLCMYPPSDTRAPIDRSITTCALHCMGVALPFSPVPHLISYALMRWCLPCVHTTYYSGACIATTCQLLPAGGVCATDNDCISSQVYMCTFNNTVTWYAIHIAAHYVMWLCIWYVYVVFNEWW